MTTPQRGHFGQERYEKEEFQRTVRATFLALMEEDKVCVYVSLPFPKDQLLITLMSVSSSFCFHHVLFSWIPHEWAQGVQARLGLHFCDVSSV